MEFRLTYEGPLPSTQQAKLGDQWDKRADLKHAIRMHFHPQLKRLWETVAFLKTGGRTGPGVYVIEGSPEPPLLDAKKLGERHSLYGWQFVPLVTDELDVSCGLEILFLRPDSPGSLVSSGDIDNRLKTLIDTLRIPVAGERYVNRQMAEPMFCLLEDDRLVTKLSVETDQLLDVPNKDASHVKIVIRVTIRAYELTLHNLFFG